MAVLGINREVETANFWSYNFSHKVKALFLFQNAKNNILQLLFSPQHNGEPEFRLNNVVKLNRGSDKTITPNSLLFTPTFDLGGSELRILSIPYASYAQQALMPEEEVRDFTKFSSNNFTSMYGEFQVTSPVQRYGDHWGSLVDMVNLLSSRMNFRVRCGVRQTLKKCFDVVKI